MSFQNTKGFAFGILELAYDANAVINSGEIVVTSNGYANAGSTATGLRAIGISLDTFDNTAGGAGAPTKTTPAGTLRVETSYPKEGGRKFFWLKNDTGGNAFAQADVFTNPAYVKNATTVTKSSSGTSKAGTVVAYDPVNNLVGVLFDQVA